MNESLFNNTHKPPDNLFGRGDAFRKILKSSLDLLDARHTGIVYGTDKTLSRFLPTQQWDRGIIDKFEARGYQRVILRLFGTYMVKACGLSPIFFNIGEGSKQIKNPGMIAYVLRTCDSYYKKGIQVLIFPGIKRDLSSDSNASNLQIPFYSYNGKEFAQPDIPIKADNNIIKYFEAKNFISIYLPDYGILVINSANENLLKLSGSTFVRKEELQQRLDDLITIVEKASLAYLGQLKGKKGAKLLYKKEERLRKTAIELMQKEKRLEQTQISLANNEKKYQDLYENAPNAYFSTDKNTTIIGYNKTTSLLLGYDNTELLGTKAIQLFADTMETQKRVGEIENHLANGDSIKNIEIQVKDVKGEFLWVNLSIDPVRDIKGELTGTRTILTDISDKKHLERQLLQSQKMEAIGTLAGGIAHDFNNILFPIMGYSEMLLTDYPNDQEIQESIRQIHNGASNARDLVSQILMFSRQKENQLIPLKIQLTIKEIIKLIQSAIPSTIEIKYSIDKNVGKIMADPVQIHQVIMNLITNAFHAMEEKGGVLTVSFEERDNIENVADVFPVPAKAYACLSVRDTGPGIDSKIANRIFDPYFTTKKEGKGTGLGLSVVHGIVKAHEGHIAVDSSPGNGSVFTIYLPLIFEKTQEMPEASPKTHDKKAISGNERILVVDDNHEVVTMVHFYLERQGYQVTDCVNSLEALKVFSKSPELFDLVITDLTMPGMTGDNLSRKIMNIRPDIPIILCTGFSNLMDQEKADTMGIKGFLQKPINTSSLGKMIRTLLDSQES